MVKSKEFWEAEMTSKMVHRAWVSMETKGEGRQDRKGDTQQRRVATGEGRLLPIQSRASFIAKAEIHEG